MIALCTFYQLRRCFLVSIVISFIFIFLPILIPGPIIYCAKQANKIHPPRSNLFTAGNRSMISVCSAKADRRGYHQDVVSYSIYGDFSRKKISEQYLEPFLETVQLIPRVYPGRKFQITPENN